MKFMPKLSTVAVGFALTLLLTFYLENRKPSEPKFLTTMYTSTDGKVFHGVPIDTETGKEIDVPMYGQDPPPAVSGGRIYTTSSTRRATQVNIQVNITSTRTFTCFEPYGHVFGMPAQISLTTTSPTPTLFDCTEIK